ncbi:MULTISPECIES: FimB/Mfa2 family fimbrial subunit [unclassified Sphingobacterium]|uniref:FimB/Mfa2 family fimbrial subunit n=1 Tax=unclassified Sphingobacterium TaxID=2609468 RepID=UPI0025D35AD2|nr:MULTISPECIES: BACON domain-containing carbohydrate-binding protein [unclassified Sphingobacterium]
MEKIRLPILLMCIFMIALLSCSKEKTITDDTTAGTNNTKDVTFTVALPGMSQNISTYAITENEENKISTIDVLVFLVSGSSETYAYRVRGRNIRQLTTNTVQFQVSLQTHASNSYRFVVIANAKAIVDGISYNTNESKPNVTNKLIINKSTAWNTTSSVDYDPIPMWGEAAPVIVSDKFASSINVNLLRSLARVDVNVEPTLAPVFRMTSISVYNSNANGRIAPEASKYNVGEKKVTAPSIPSPLQTNSTPLVYNISNPLKSEQEIYLFEKAAAASAGVSGALSLIIGGRYGGSSTETYYKVEFLSPAAVPSPVPLLRNFKYVFNITDIAAEGHATRESALAAKPSNMQVSLLTINENDLPVIYFDEHYYLAMQTDLVNYPTDQGGGDAYKIKTDFPGGWTWISDRPWLSVHPYNDGSDRANITVLINPSNPQSPRSGTVTIIAGKIRGKIKVYQGYGTNPLPDIP